MPTPNMGMTLPTPDVTAGPEWATELNTALDQIDAHDHTSGKGVQVPSNGLNLNADLPFVSNNATQLRSVRFNPQSAALALTTDIGCAYVSGVDLWYNDGNGIQIQLTAGGALNAASIGGIGGDYTTSPGVSLAYSSATKTFTFIQATNRSAAIDCGNVTIHDQGATSTNGITIKSPSGVSAAYALTLPSALPSSHVQLVTIDTTGAVATSDVVDNSTLQLSSGVMSIKANGVGTAQLANAAVTATQIASGAVGTTQLASAAVTATQLASNAVTTAKILDANVTTSKIADANVTSAKIAAGAVGPSQVAITPNWTGITPASNWSGTGAWYGKDALNFVHLFGNMDHTGGTAGSDPTITTLPAGFRPLTARVFPTPVGGSITVNTSGTVVVASSPAPGQSVFLDGIHFSTDI